MFGIGRKTATASDPAIPPGQQRLDELQIQECAFVRRVDADPADADRLKTMGVCSGRKVQLIQRGDPMIVRVLGSRLGISGRLGRRVIVESCGDPACAPPDQD